MKKLTILPVLALLACNPNETPPPAHADYDGGVGTALSCVPNLDGKIDSNELVPEIGIPASYLVSPVGKTRTVDLVGGQNLQGQTVWSFGDDYADDMVAHLAAQPLDGKWYAGSFAGLSSPVVVALDVGDRTEGVYTQDATGFYLHGVASVTEDAVEGKTLLVYQDPVQLYKFPLQNGSAWTATGVVNNGILKGLPFADRETYDIKVDGSGEIDLPDFTITQALRIRTNITISPSAGAVTTQKQVGFLFECLGEVARATSNLNETNDNFTTAMELRRLGLSD